ncbi:sensor histidine kinase KdpD [Novosphingobium sp. TH158]|uniref:sensor histidine kinase n=1 Tax=Novosphingobium sp. TH158 TaxID=2067455 RepID=UPI000C7AB9BB|nr:HAMP domain-containing sensor histidine kinase [Novosphingobium sp. TH158]PLK25818.1 sensor histidine kinase [Novosphingobium sp. TH158]
MKANGAPGIALARTDAEDRLVSADEPLRSFQLRCGGEIPGVVAAPALLEIVRKSRRFGMKLSRPFAAQDGVESVTALAEIEPAVDGGCTIRLRHWQARSMPVEDQAEVGERVATIDRDIAEFHARLDADQQVITAEAGSDELKPLATAMLAMPGKVWTGYVEAEGAVSGKVTHWRLLNGVSVKVAGSPRPWRVTLTPLGGTPDQPAGFELALTSDIAPPPPAPPPPAGLRKAEARLIGRDVAPVLRQPIARIIANAETIRTRLAGPLAEEYSNYAADIAAAGQHLLALIDDLTDLEVVEADDFSTAPDNVDLADIARRAAGILGVRAREQGVIVDAPRAGETLPAIAEFRRVLQVLLNLLGNAIRYSPPNSQVWIRLERIGDFARVIVADQGPGLSADEQARVFDKFERLGRSGDGGSGLGLYISRRLARAMGGDLTVESAPGQGARFNLSVPADLKADSGL